MWISWTQLHRTLNEIDFKITRIKAISNKSIFIIQACNGGFRIYIILCNHIYDFFHV